MESYLIRDLTRKLFVRKALMRALYSRFLNRNTAYRALFHKLIRSKIKKYASAPPIIYLEPTNSCNGKCSFCPRTGQTRKTGAMSTELYNSIVDQSAEWGVRKLQLTGFGEPLLDPNIIQKVEYGKKKGIPIIEIITNGSFLTEDKIDAVFDSGLDRVVVSVEGGDRESFEKKRVGLDYNKVMENIFLLCEKRKRLNKKKPEIVINTVQCGESFNDVENVYKKFSGIADNINVQYYNNWVGGMGQGGDDGGLKPLFRSFPCHQLWFLFNIRWDGTVSLCCLDFDNRVILGDANTQSLKEIWNGERLNQLRNQHLKGQAANLPLCEDCSDYPNWWANYY